MSLISSASSYSIRAILYIATAETRDTSFVSTRRMAEELGVPSAFLSKVLQRLTREGILVSQRGAAGGVRVGEAACGDHLARDRTERRRRSSFP